MKDKIYLCHYLDRVKMCPHSDLVPLKVDEVHDNDHFKFYS